MPTVKAVAAAGTRCGAQLYLERPVHIAVSVNTGLRLCKFETDSMQQLVVLRSAEGLLA